MFTRKSEILGTWKKPWTGAKSSVVAPLAALRNRRRGDLPGVVQHAVLAVDLRTMQPNVSVPGMMCSSCS